MLTIIGRHIKYINICTECTESIVRRSISFTSSVNKEKTPRDNDISHEKPILEVISSRKIKKQSDVILENVKEKSLDKPSESSSLISSESMRKLKEKIIGRSEKEIDSKGKKIVLGKYFYWQLYFCHLLSFLSFSWLKQIIIKKLPVFESFEVEFSALLHLIFRNTKVVINLGIFSYLLKHFV